MGGGKGSKGSKGGSKTGGAKSASGMASTSRIIPARINEDVEMTVRTLSTSVFKVLMTSGVCRIDFLIDRKTNEVYVNEINTIPGFLAFYLWQPFGKDYTQLINDLFKFAVKRTKEEEQKKKIKDFF